MRTTKVLGLTIVIGIILVSGINLFAQEKKLIRKMFLQM